MQNILEVKNLSKIYPLKKGEFTALDNVSLTLKRGEALGIVGESGSGKSTLAKIITQIEQPSSGQVLYAGKDIYASSKKEQYDIRRQIQMVFQNPRSTISPRMSIGTFLTEALVNYKIMSMTEAKKEAVRLLELVELPSTYMNKFSSQVSGGEMQRVVIARALSVKPQIIVFDEATSALDVLVRQKILDLLLKLKKQFDFSYLFIGHNLAVVRIVSSRMIVMKNGKIVEMLASNDFVRSAQNDYTKTLISSVLTTADKKH